MRSMMILATAAALAAATPAAAQDAGWEFTATDYVWLPVSRVTLDTPRGSLSAKLSLEDAIEALDFAAMGTFEARRGKLGLAADLLYFDLSQSADTPFDALFAQGRVESKVTAVTALAMWRVQESATFALDLGAGLRAFNTDVEARLSGGALPDETFRAQDDWIDPVIALRARVDFDAKWYGTLYLDAGGSGDSETRQAALGVGYRINDRWSVLGGWRYMDFERDTNGRSLDLSMSGLILGASYRF